jgi:hypothetical protein
MTSTIKVNTIQNTCGADIIKESSNTITIGASGDTVTLASGASQSGFGRSGSVNWQTTKKTTGFTAANGEGYFCDTSGGAFTVTLPSSPSAGDIVAVADYTRTFNTNKLTIGRNSQPIGGLAFDAELTVNGQAATFVYVDGTEGWINVQNAEDTETGTSPYVVASGGTESTVGDFKVHTFTGPGTFTVTAAGQPSGSNTVEYIVIGGGGSGGRGYYGGGGGAGGFRFASPTLAPATYPAKPLAGPAALSVPVAAYPIVVGAGGGAQPPSSKNPGSNSSFSTITSAGGGAGGNRNSPTPNKAGDDGASGGGHSNTPGNSSGNTPPVAPPQGNNGGGYFGGGGGGATAVGASDDGAGSPYGAAGGAGGGFPNAFGTSGESCGSFYYFSGGGGGGGNAPTSNLVAGVGGGGNGGECGGCGSGQAGTANTGGGGGGGGGNESLAGAGGSGIVIIRYKFQN